MLYLDLNEGDKVRVGVGDVTVLELEDGSVRLGFHFPRSIPIWHQHAERHAPIDNELPEPAEARDGSTR